MISLVYEQKSFKVILWFQEEASDPIVFLSSACTSLGIHDINYELSKIQ